MSSAVAAAAVLLYFKSADHGEAGPVRDNEKDEFIALAQAAHYKVAAMVLVSKRRLQLRYCVGRGKSEEIKKCLAAVQAGKLITSHALSPWQAYYLERATAATVVDRSALILEIFSRRARSHEGKLQVELAQLDYMATRLVRSWSHLERQKGGIGVRAGPGEKQVETDRRLLRQRINKLRAQLHKIKSQRHVSRRLRSRRGVCSIALVGYTNAGKTSVFNRLTKAHAHTADALFVTLDPMIRRLWSGPGAEIVISDTVGFIKNLPSTLIAAFNATLLEVSEADLLLHVVDDSDDLQHEHCSKVQGVLEDIGAQSIPQLLVNNKIDLSGARPAVKRNGRGEVCSIAVSAATGAGLDVLRQVLIDYCRRATPGVRQAMPL